MKIRNSFTRQTTKVIFKTFYLATFFLSFGSFGTLEVYAQSGNTISGYVFGSQRQPVGEITVELLDEFSRAVARARTSAAGRYFFDRLPAGRFRIRVLPQGTNYEEQEQEIEIINHTRESLSGVRTVSGFDNVQRDFYLKPRKGDSPTGRSESIFVQNVPEQAKETYRKAIESFDSKNEEAALKQLKSAIEIFPDYYEAIERLGTEYVKLKHYLAAEILLRRAVEINPRGYRSWYGLAYARYSQDKMTEALEAADKAASLNQSSVEALLLKGVLYKKTKNYEQAEKQLKRAKDLAKGAVAEVHWQLALLYGNNLARYREAADELELYLKAQPDNKNAENIKKLIKQFREKATSK